MNMETFFNQFWIILIIMICANGVIWKSKSNKYIAENPELKEGYDSLVKGWMIFGNIPWIIMGIGMLTGLTKNIFDFFNPKQMNPVVITFFLALIIEWILCIYWIFFKGGAEKLVKHPGLFTQTDKGNENFEIMKVKFLSVAVITAGIIAIVVMWKMNIPIGVLGQ